ncbi:MAG: DUF370 domain-containing protein [Clostridiales bacterium]|nr:DUF370 domain-containing protein [Clostridiales bacterium]
MAFIQIGFGNIVSVDRLICVVSPDSAPVRRIVQDARDRGSLIDASSGKKSKAVLIMDSDHVILSAMPAEDIRRQLGQTDSWSGTEEEP